MLELAIQRDSGFVRFWFDDDFSIYCGTSSTWYLCTEWLESVTHEALISSQYGSIHWDPQSTWDFKAVVSRSLQARYFCHTGLELICTMMCVEGSSCITENRLVLLDVLKRMTSFGVGSEIKAATAESLVRRRFVCLFDVMLLHRQGRIVGFRRPLDEKQNNHRHGKTHRRLAGEPDNDNDVGFLVTGPRRLSTIDCHYLGGKDSTVFSTWRREWIDVPSGEGSMEHTTRMFEVTGVSCPFL